MKEELTNVKDDLISSNYTNIVFENELIWVKTKLEKALKWTISSQPLIVFISQELWDTIVKKIDTTLQSCMQKENMMFHVSIMEGIVTPRIYVLSKPQLQKKGGNKDCQPG